MIADSLSSYIVRQLYRNDHGDLTEAGNLTVLFPCALEDHLVHSVLFNCVGVRATCFQKIAYDRCGSFVMTIEQVPAYEVTAFLVLLDSPVILVEDDSVFVAH